MTLRGFGPPAAGNEEPDGPSDLLSLFGSPPLGNQQIELAASSLARVFDAGWRFSYKTLSPEVRNTRR